MEVSVRRNLTKFAKHNPGAKLGKHGSNNDLFVQKIYVQHSSLIFKIYSHPNHGKVTVGEAVYHMTRAKRQNFKIKSQR